MVVNFTVYHKIVREARTIHGLQILKLQRQLSITFTIGYKMMSEKKCFVLFMVSLFDGFVVAGDGISDIRWSKLKSFEY